MPALIAFARFAFDTFCSVLVLLIIWHGFFH
jgi:hypothetical protein